MLHELSGVCGRDFLVLGVEGYSGNSGRTVLRDRAVAARQVKKGLFAVEVFFLGGKVLLSFRQLGFLLVKLFLPVFELFLFGVQGRLVLFKFRLFSGGFGTGGV